MKKALLSFVLIFAMFAFFLFPVSDKITDTRVFAASVGYGDVNGDNSIDLNDAILAAKIDAGLAKIEDKNFKSSDVNGDGKVDVKDALLIARYVAKLIKRFPADSSIVFPPVPIG